MIDMGAVYISALESEVEKRRMEETRLNSVPTGERLEKALPRPERVEVGDLGDLASRECDFSCIARYMKVV